LNSIGLEYKSKFALNNNKFIKGIVIFLQKYL
jgi:hypothetical protein